MTRGSETRVRSKHLTIRLTPDERVAIDEAADKAGLTAGSYARQAILGGTPPRQARRPPVERRELARILGQLGHIGSNLNQIARAANSDEQIDVIDLSTELKHLDLAREAILKALGRDA